MTIVTNTTPWTYFGDRPLEPTPDASFDTGLDVFALRRLGTLSTAAKLRRLLAGGPDAARPARLDVSRPARTHAADQPADAGRGRWRIPRRAHRLYLVVGAGGDLGHRLTEVGSERHHRPGVWRIPQSEIAELHQICQIDRPRALRSDQPPG